jgi:hypothetical protein
MRQSHHKSGLAVAAHGFGSRMFEPLVDGARDGLDDSNGGEGRERRVARDELRETRARMLRFALRLTGKAGRLTGKAGRW